MNAWAPRRGPRAEDLRHGNSKHIFNARQRIANFAETIFISRPFCPDTLRPIEKLFSNPPPPGKLVPTQGELSRMNEYEMKFRYSLLR